MREWLERQSVAGFLAVERPRGEAPERRYVLPEAHRAVFVQEVNLSYLTGMAQFVLYRLVA